MERMTVEWFLAAGGDAESARYRILQGLKGCREEFAHNRLYPVLADLIDLYNGLSSALDNRDGFERQTPHRLTGVDVRNKQLLYEPFPTSDGEFERTMDLIAWALPHLRDVIDEGVCIYNFVDERLSIDGVGIIPMYKDEGYWFVPEVRNALLHLIRYQVSLYSAGKEQYRIMKTRIVDSLRQLIVRRSPESIKLELIGRYHDLPNPATFMCETDLEFPFTETIFPIAKRKFMSVVFP